MLFDEIERLAEMPMANEAINAMLERIDLRIGLYFENAMKGKRPVRKVARGIIALGDFPLPVPPYGEPRVLPTAALDAGLQRRLAAELEAAGQPGAIAPTIESGGCCRDYHGHHHHFSEVAARCRDVVLVDAADPPAYGDGREIRPTGTVPEGIVPSRAKQGIAAASCSVLCTRPYHWSKIALILGLYVHFTAADLGRFAIKRRPSGWRSGPSRPDCPLKGGRSVLVLFDPSAGPQSLVVPLAESRSGHAGDHWNGDHCPYDNGPVTVFAPQHIHPHPALSPDGSRVVFTSDTSGGALLYEVTLR